jgi:ribonuclease HII
VVVRASGAFVCPWQGSKPCAQPRRGAKLNDVRRTDPIQAANAIEVKSASARKQRFLKTLRCGSRFELAARRGGARFVAGVDEVGRGALFGCVAAAACILDPKRPIAGLRDSKQLSPATREALAAEIRAAAVAWSVAEVAAAEIDRINIGRACRLAMRLAVEKLETRPDYLLVDGNQRIDFHGPQQPIVNGDALSVSIAAASILAKVHRDAIVRALDADYPQYGLARHKGYGTAEHLAALALHGPSPLHRRSFSPVAACDGGAAGLAGTQNSFAFAGKAFGIEDDEAGFAAEEASC